MDDNNFTPEKEEFSYSRPVNTPAVNQPQRPPVNTPYGNQPQRPPVNTPYGNQPQRPPVNNPYVNQPQRPSDMPYGVSRQPQINTAPAESFVQPVPDDDEKPEKKKSKKKPVIIITVIVAVIGAAALALFLCKGMIYYQLALNYVRNNDYETAEDMVKNAEGDGTKVLSKYIKLRVEFNKDYRSMLTDFDPDTITDWYEKAEKVTEDYDVLPEDIRTGVDDFRNRLGIINDSLNVYSNLRYDIIDMMDIFAEINRLVATNPDGSKTPFTVSEILARVERWEIICNNLNTFSTNAPNGDSVYLLSYLISETYSECTELKNQMQAIVDAGHGTDEEITSAGEGTESFPSVTNSEGVSLNFNDPETYEKYMYTDICIAMMKYMAVCYYGD